MILEKKKKKRRKRERERERERKMLNRGGKGKSEKMGFHVNCLEHCCVLAVDGEELLPSVPLLLFLSVWKRFMTLLPHWVRFYFRCFRFVVAPIGYRSLGLASHFLMDALPLHSFRSALR